ncbi:hypothetical protein [Flavobacterium piscisymbiosum]|uniref:Uncharacterized protein n=1 Tax=Flavobacterium piscisymbiosum TaxID=2893753 RepID=A0ABS8ME34_9FLAO|nr:hypothetical protein [Flavobacterium sp. F-30]MCC9063618.1 hypothetical protein [Flavobacterium sp. F-30]
MKTSLTKALLDPFFYYNLKNSCIPSLEHLPGSKTLGLLDTPKNQIEILLDGKKLKKLKIEDIANQFLLFPLYETNMIHKTEIIESGIYIEQLSIGHIGSYELKIDNFSIENICFHLVKYRDQLLFHYPTYQNKTFLFRKKSTLITYQNSFEVL